MDRVSFILLGLLLLAGFLSWLDARDGRVKNYSSRAELERDIQRLRGQWRDGD